MKALYYILGMIGVFLILGTAGQSDVFGLQMDELMIRCGIGVVMIFMARSGLSEEKEQEKVDNSPDQREPSFKSSKAA